MQSDGPIDTPAASVAPKAGGAGRRAHDARRKERTRRRMLDAAFRLIGNARGRNVRIEEVCAEAGTSRASFYNYFTGMEALFEALAYDLAHDFTLAVIAAMNRLPSAADQVDFALRCYLQRVRTDPEWGWAMVNIGATGPLFGAETFASALQTVEAGIRSGEFAVGDPLVGRDLILGTAHAAVITHLTLGSAEDQPRQVSRAVLRGLGVHPDRIEAMLEREPGVAL